nr:MAG TPA: hypothetical protein [Caudoviricetes sp.]
MRPVCLASQTTVIMRGSKMSVIYGRVLPCLTPSQAHLICFVSRR